jgi:hypothetical protein
MSTPPAETACAPPRKGSTQDNKHHLAIRGFYGDRKDARSGVPLIAHIDTCLAMLECGAAQTCVITKGSIVGT